MPMLPRARSRLVGLGNPGAKYAGKMRHNMNKLAILTLFMSLRWTLLLPWTRRQIS